MALAPLPHWTFLTRHKFKDKIMKNFKMLINSSALNQTWCPSECRAGPGLRPMKPALTVCHPPERGTARQAQV